MNGEKIRKELEAIRSALFSLSAYIAAQDTGVTLDKFLIHAAQEKAKTPGAEETVNLLANMASSAGRSGDITHS